ncbi:MAG: hypothetical protein KME05_00390 [Gloeocapsa sp. UFS-A4-WI-NPMV-4B04]|nr:hypothetical protein [Gloeocapsa sp. UFS-A4-WI-NPMV-4B04]
MVAITWYWSQQQIPCSSSSNQQPTTDSSSNVGRSYATSNNIPRVLLKL